jgi:hypothetical protein
LGKTKQKYLGEFESKLSMEIERKLWSGFEKSLGISLGLILNGSLWEVFGGR